MSSTKVSDFSTLLYCETEFLLYLFLLTSMGDLNCQAKWSGSSTNVSSKFNCHYGKFIKGAEEVHAYT